MVAAESGDCALADASFERAVAIDRTFGLPWDEAKVLAEWGRVLRRRNIRGELERARERESAAFAIFGRLGASHELARLRADGG